MSLADELAEAERNGTLEQMQPKSLWSTDGEDPWAAIDAQRGHRPTIPSFDASNDDPWKALDMVDKLSSPSPKTTAVAKAPVVTPKEEFGSASSPPSQNMTPLALDTADAQAVQFDKPSPPREPPSEDIWNIREEASKNEGVKDLEKANVFEITVTNPKVIGEGMQAHVCYTVTTKSTLDLYKSNTMQVDRRFSDFLWLKEQLELNHKAVVIPPMPDKDSISSGAFTAVTVGGTRFSPALMEYRRKELEKFLNRVATHPILCTSKYLQLFVETSADLTQVKAEEAQKANQSGGIWGLFGKASKVVTTVPVEVDDWFAKKTEYLNLLATQLGNLSRAGQAIINRHRELSVTSIEISKVLLQTSICEENSTKQNSAMFKKLSEINAQISQIESEFSEQNTTDFEHVIQEYIKWIACVKRVLDYRLEKLGEHQGANKELELRKQRLSQRPNDDRLKSSVDEAQSRVEETKEVFDTVSENVKAEFERFEAAKSIDMNEAIGKYALISMNSSLRVLHMITICL